MPEDTFSSTLILVHAARDGDRSALQELVSEYLPQVRQIVALRSGKRLLQFMEIDDLVQEAIMRILGGLDGFEQRSHGAFRNWLARCVEHEIIDQARALDRKRRGGGRVMRLADFDSNALASSIFGDVEQPSPSELAQAVDVAERIEVALLELPEHQRELVILRALCGMEYAEVAESLGIEKEGTVRVAYSRALKKLKELMGLE